MVGDEPTSDKEATGELVEFEIPDCRAMRPDLRNFKFGGAPDFIKLADALSSRSAWSDETHRICKVLRRGHTD
jgi:hypothetical protein